MHLPTLIRSRKLLILLLIIGGCITAVHSQNYINQKSFAGATFGPISYRGIYSKDASFVSHTSFAASVFYSHRIVLPKQLYIRGELNLGELAGNDTAQISRSNTGWFRCYNVEGSAKVEYELMDLYRYKFSPYIIAGVGAYALFDYESSRGDEKPTNQIWGIVVPVGGGIKYRINKRFKIFAEGNYRFFPKNIDNYIVDGTSNRNNYYSFVLGAAVSLQRFNILW